VIATVSIAGMDRELTVVEQQYIADQNRWAVTLVVPGTEHDHYIGYGHTLEVAIWAAIEVVMEQGLHHFHD
jgi:hypothetical protein